MKKLSLVVTMAGMFMLQGCAGYQTRINGISTTAIGQHQEKQDFTKSKIVPICILLAAVIAH